MNIEPIAHVVCDFQEKFGLPRQSGLADTLGTVVFEPAYRDINAFKGLEAFSHIWLIWEFAAFGEGGESVFSPTVRPPRLGGNTRVGVFATRAPNRPNRLGLSCVRLIAVETDREYGPVLRISGGDMRSGTPVYDIKPYIAFADAIPDAVSGFAEQPPAKRLDVRFSPQAEACFSEAQRLTLAQALSYDPRPSYTEDTDRQWGMLFGGYNVLFTVRDGELYVTRAQKIQNTDKEIHRE